MMDSQTEAQRPPSAQIVGQEFVKQYYTMLNAAPGHLHRFYSNNSSFIHGNADGRGEDQQAVTGQVEIHRKIMSLNFNNCHARICQVDSQSSVGGSVVVQVIGELSNDGQPMRRFVQTFVLAPQSAKKYYVHSDIFRYQDIYFPAAADSGCAETEGEYVEEETPGEYTEQLRYDGSGEQGEQVTDGVGYEEQEQELAADSGCDVSDVAITPAHVAVAPEPDNGVTGVEVEPTAACSETVEAAQQQFADTTEVEAEKSAPAEQQQPEEEQQPVEAAEKVVEPEPVQPAAPPKPMTWAAMASRNAGNLPVAPPAGSAMTRVARTQPAAAAETKSEPRQQPSQRPASNVEERTVNGRPLVNGGKDENNGGGVRRSVGGGGFSPQVQIYPDSQQVFIGNLPQAFTDQEVMEFFEQYGKVLDFKINRKPGGAGGNNVGQKNFGFMSFDSADTVKKVLDARPIFMRKYRLNIEEKKPKEELAAARFSAPRYPGGNAAGGMQFVRSGDGAAPRRGGFNRPGDVRSNSSDDGRA